MIPVDDPDDLLFLLYSFNQQQPSHGLGYIDNHAETLNVSFDLGPTTSLDVELVQDRTALHTRKGDTGSVLWQASIDFAKLILTQPDGALLPHNQLKDQHVLELGSGVGLLSIALSPLVRRYTATDIEHLVPLIQKNIALNLLPKAQQPAKPANNKKGKPHRHPPRSHKLQQSLSPSCTNQAHVTVAEELDWEFLARLSPSDRAKNFGSLRNDPPIDTILAVDCIYHPNLLPPFIETLDYLAIPGRTSVVVVSELRAEDVMREFLEMWVEREGWKIWYVPDLMEKRYVVLVGRKNPEGATPTSHEGDEGGVV